MLQWWYLNLDAAVYQSPQLLGFTACCEAKPQAGTVCCTAMAWNVPLLCQSGSLLWPAMTQQSQEITTERWTPALSQVWSVFAVFLFSQANALASVCWGRKYPCHHWNMEGTLLLTTKTQEQSCRFFSRTARCDTGGHWQREKALRKARMCSWKQLNTRINSFQETFLRYGLTSSHAGLLGCVGFCCETVFCGCGRVVQEASY